MKQNQHTSLSDLFFVLLALLQVFGLVCAFFVELVPVYALGHVLLIVAVIIDKRNLPESSDFSFVLNFGSAPTLGEHGTAEFKVTKSFTARHSPSQRLTLVWPQLVTLFFARATSALRPMSAGNKTSYSAHVPFLARTLGFEIIDVTTVIANSKLGLFNREMSLKPAEPLHFRVMPGQKQLSPPVLREILGQQKVFVQGNKNLMRHLSPDQFHSIRLYQSGDAMKFIDAKKFAHFGKPMTRVFDSFNQHHLVIALDCGRASLGNLDQSLKFDYYLSACLKIAETAIKAGDRVSFFAFSQKIHMQVNQTKSIKSLHPLYEGHQKIAPKEVDSSFELMVQGIAQLAKQRSIVMVLTDTTRPSIQEALKRIIPTISRQHIVVTLTLIDSNYGLEKLVASSVSKNLTEQDYSRLMYSCFLKERLMLFRGHIGKYGSGALTINEKDWMAVVIKVYDLLRASAGL